MNSDAPFCDIKSWAGVLYNGAGSTNDWEKCLKTLGLTKDSVLGFEDISLYTSLNVANANIPVLHVCGDSDKVVPYKENTGKVQVISKLKVVLFR